MYFEKSENGEGHSYLCMISHTFAIPFQNVKKEQVFSLKKKKKKKEEEKKKKEGKEEEKKK